MYYIKICLWIFIMSVLYATGLFDLFGTSPAFLLIFAFVFSTVAKKAEDRITVAFICGIFSSALSNSNFIITVLIMVYGAVIAGSIFEGELSRYSYCVVILIFFANMFSEVFCGFIAEGFAIEVFFESLFCAVVNFIFALILYPLIKRTFCKKERYIFEEL